MKTLLTKYNSLPYDHKSEKREVLEQLFGSIGTNVSVGSPFTCDYGCNIYLGKNVSVNMNCTFVDCNKITIGNNVLIASNVQIYTATHPVELNERLTPNWNPESGEYFLRNSKIYGGIICIFMATMNISINMGQLSKVDLVTSIKSWPLVFIW